jgi:hypothetical protein
VDGGSGSYQRYDNQTTAGEQFMNLAKRDLVLQELGTTPPTEFYKAYYLFWADALGRYIDKLPEQHRRDRYISAEAVRGFESCLSNKPKWDTLEKQP